MEEAEKERQPAYWWRKEEDSPNQCETVAAVGQECPSCANGKLAYDGLFVLTCSACGYCADHGAFT